MPLRTVPSELKIVLTSPLGPLLPTTTILSAWRAPLLQTLEGSQEAGSTELDAPKQPFRSLGHQSLGEASLPSFSSGQGGILGGQRLGSVLQLLRTLLGMAAWDKR